MAKPLNKFALFLWILAFAFLVADVPATLALRDMILRTSYPAGVAQASAVSWLNVWSQIRSAAISSAQLAAFGVVIELLDRIRWNALPPELRVRGRGFLWNLRNWPHSVEDSRN
ncbi:MAG: hypothetical protein JO056_08250 [Alphaproteobacteria bacterium]|nr:hypothetical protein [Alphaproteobacteria bacterium]